MRAVKIVYLIISVVAAEVSKSHAQHQEEPIIVENESKETTTTRDELSVSQSNEWIPGNFTQGGIIQE
jgi:hypothetical protein